MMEGPTSCNIEESQLLITGTLSFEEGTFSVLPVLVGGQVGELDRDSLESEQLLLTVPVITLSDSNQSSVTGSSATNTEIVPEAVCLLDVNSVESANEVDIIELPQEEEVVTDELESSPQALPVEQAPVFEAQTLFDLGLGTYAYLHDQPQDGCQVLKMDDGRVAYITVIPPPAGERERERLTVEESPERAKRFMCGYEGCGRLYTSAHHLKVHDRTHTGSRPFLCSRAECGKAFSTEYGRKAHARTHTGERPYACPRPACGRCFNTSGDLQKHVRTHTGERPFTCPVEGCNRSFTTSNIRKVHIRTHTGERPYICKVANCDKAFASATNYKNHMRIHSGEKPYACTVPGCEKRFTEYSSLYKHAMVHTQARPYVCGACGRGYRQPSTLAVHRRSVHGFHGDDDTLGRMLGRAADDDENDEFLLDSEGSYQTISTDQIFIIEDMPKQFAALQHIGDPDDEELKAALDPLKKEEF